MNYHYNTNLRKKRTVEFKIKFATSKKCDAYSKHSR